MQQEFLNISPDTWCIIFDIIRYVVVALILAYLTNVYVKRKNIHTDIKGRLLEWRVETYKNLHRWVMIFQNVTAAPSQDEEHYRNILAPTKFKIGYQGMKYASFFDTPERLLKFHKEFNQMFNKEKDFIDYPLMHELNGFQLWLEDVRMYYMAFIRTETDKRWNFSDETIDKHCKLAIKVMGIALQEDVNRFYHKFDEILRDRLRNIKISEAYSEGWLTKLKRMASDYSESVMDKDENRLYPRIVKWFYYHTLYRSYDCSEVRRNFSGLITMFLLIHFEELFASKPAVMEDKNTFTSLSTEFYNCYTQYCE